MTIRLVTYAEGFAALDMLVHALKHVSGQFSLDMERPEAVAHFEARKILIERHTALLDEIELEYFYGSGAQ